MNKIQQLQENIFTQIAKALALSQLKKELPKAIKELEGDANLQSTLESMKFYADEIDRQLKHLCEKNPNHKKCKEKAKSK